MRFKSGDVVIFTGNHPMAAKAGAVAVVQQPPYSHESHLCIRWVPNSLSGSQKDGGYDEGGFRLAFPPEIFMDGQTVIVRSGFVTFGARVYSNAEVRALNDQLQD